MNFIIILLSLLTPIKLDVYSLQDSKDWLAIIFFLKCIHWKRRVLGLNVCTREWTFHTGADFQNTILAAILHLPVSHLRCKKTLKKVLVSFWVSENTFFKKIKFKKIVFAVIRRNLLWVSLKCNLWYNLDYLRYIWFKCLNNIKMIFMYIWALQILYSIFLKNQLLVFLNDVILKMRLLLNFVPVLQIMM